METILARIKIPAKIIAVLLMLGIATISVAFISSNTLKKADTDYSQLTDHKLPVTTKLARVNRHVTAMVYAGYRTLAYPGGSAAGREAVEAEKKSFDAANKLLDEVQALDPSATDIVQTVRGKVADIHALTEKAAALGYRDENDAARALLSETDPKVIAFSDATAAINDGRIKDANAISANLSSELGSTSTMLLVVSFLATLGMIALGYLVARMGITGPIAKLQATMHSLAGGNHHVEVEGTERADELGAMAQAVLVFRDNAIAQEESQKAKAIADAEQKHVVEVLGDSLGKLAAGDLTCDIRENFAADYAVVRENFNQAVSGLRDLIGSVLESTASIRTGSAEIAQASEDLARRTEANAASLEETSAAVTEMDQRLRATADSAKSTVTRADGAMTTVSGGRETADEALQAMTRVAESAKGIDSVIEGLDKIAFQTRVLAMNAAVEAGRAGEAGRGFAVVADLVSALAMRSEEEASRAREQLTATQSDVVAAVEMVKKVDEALANITGDVTEVHSLLNQMATDNQAQSSAISQISTAIGTMDQATQQNAAMVEETSAAARNLNSEVGTLTEKASKFRIDGMSHTAPIARTPTRSPAPAPRAPARAAKAKPSDSGYVSPVKPLPGPVAANGHDDWTSF